MSMLGVIPARFASTRFPGKPLVDVAGMSLIERVYRRAAEAGVLHKVVVATDDTRILNHVRQFGGEALMTRSDHATGTERCVEVAAQYPQYDYVVNIHRSRTDRRSCAATALSVGSTNSHTRQSHCPACGYFQSQYRKSGTQ